ncbi:unnamed protein product [Peniophora sp. CBMAI 1063]|nr:unnamed protein product [Peniophora sp. CBMAI 1063]
MSETKHLSFGELVDRPVLRLPRLKGLRLDLDMHGWDINIFIKSLSIPSSAQLLVYKAKFIAVGDFALFETAFKTVTAATNEEIALTLTGNDFKLETAPHPGHPRRLKAEITGSNLGDIAYALHGPQLGLQDDFKRVTHLTIRFPPHYPVEAWEHIFHLVKSADTLEIAVNGPPNDVRGVPAIFEALEQCFDEYNIPLPSLPLPNLAHIVLRLQLPATLAQTITRKHIVECLQTRAFAEARPIQTLCLYGALRDTALVHLLRGLVSHLEWKNE